MTPKLLRRIAIAVIAPLMMLATACGSDDTSTPPVTKAPDAVAGGKVTVVSQQFPEADILTELYTALLTQAGFTVDSKAIATRKTYLQELIDGKVQISTDYLSSMTEALNQKVNGEKAATVASHDSAATLAAFNTLGAKVGLTALEPAQAQDANAFAVTKAFADEKGIKTLSDLAALNLDIKLGAAPDCDERKDCKLGLESVYGLKIVKVEPTEFGSDQTKADVKSGATLLGQVGTSDATLEKDGLVVLEDDKGLQNAENLVPIVNTAWLKAHPQAADALNPLSAILTTDDLALMIAKVSLEKEKAKTVALAFLQEKGLLK